VLDRKEEKCDGDSKFLLLKEVEERSNRTLADIPVLNFRKVRRAGIHSLTVSQRITR